MQEHLALQELYVANYSKFFSFAKFAVSDPLMAEDLVQDTFVIALHRIDVLLASENPCGWLQNTLKNVIGNAYQKRRIPTVDISAAVGVHSDAHQFSVFDLYAGIIDDSSLRLLTWIYCDGICHQEAADRLGISVETCKKRTQRAKQALGKAISAQQLL